MMNRVSSLLVICLLTPVRTTSPVMLHARPAAAIMQPEVNAGGSPLRAAFTRPESPYIEYRGRQQLTNFDLVVQNRGAQAWRLVAIRLKVYDHDGRLELIRQLNGNGDAPAMVVMGRLDLAPHSSIDLFQPFVSFDETVDLSTMHYEVLLNKAGHEALPIPFTADETMVFDVHPRPYHPARYCLPLQGKRILVQDGHDFYAHHRRDLEDVPADAVADPEPDPDFYAYDLLLTDSRGELYARGPADKHHWFVYGAPVYAPAGGIVTEVESDIRERSFDPDGRAVPSSNEDRSIVPGLGNHILIRHADGRVSRLAHLQTGSVLVKAGQRVRAGAPIARAGFSGDALFPHLHYDVVSEKSTLAPPAHGVPSYFRGLLRILGSRRVALPSGEIDSGDWLESPACH